MSLRAVYDQLGAARRLSQARADEIVAAARPMALVALGRAGEPPAALNVVASEVEPASNRGGSLIPAWPQRDADDRVTIEFIDDWGAMLSVWRFLVDSAEVDDLLQSGQRLWIGIANDVVQLFVPDPPDGTYSMVRHHALMLVAATVWLGPDATRRWQSAHTLAARQFLRTCVSSGLWAAVESAEAGLSDLLADTRWRQSAGDSITWLERDHAALTAYQAYLGAASLGVAALLDSAPVWTPDHLTELILRRHADPDFNREEIERFAVAVGA
jgi:hypothetical protein